MTKLSISVLRPNTISEKIYGTIKNDPHFQILKDSIATDGILEPLVITQSNFIISGVRRYYAAIDLKVEFVPVVFSDLNEDDVDDLTIMIHQQHRIKTPVQIFREVELISEKFNIQKGRPKSSDEEEKEARKRRNELLSHVSKSTYNRLQKSYNNLLPIYGNRDEVIEEMIRMEREDGLNPSAILDATKTRLANHNKKESNTNDDGEKNSDKYVIIQQDSREPFSSEIKDKSVACIITSPPYRDLRDYKTGENQIGHETSLKEYIDSLVKVFNNCKRVLKDDGSVFINISDVIQDGSLLNVPGKLADALMEDGWIYNSNIIWAKDNAMFQDRKRPVPSYEHILHFTLNTSFNYNAAWANEIHPIKEMFLGDMGRTIRLKDFWDFRNLVIKCPTANNSKLSKHLLENGHDLTHSATFPVELGLSILALVKSTCKPGDIVLDCFNGLATSGISALNHDLYYVGIENNPEYSEQSKLRLDKFIEDMKNITMNECELKGEDSVVKLIDKKLLEESLYGEEDVFEDIDDFQSNETELQEAA
jgi:DNA modification methylase